MGAVPAAGPARAGLMDNPRILMTPSMGGAQGAGSRRPGHRPVPGRPRVRELRQSHSSSSRLRPSLRRLSLHLAAAGLLGGGALAGWPAWAQSGAAIPVPPTPAPTLPPARPSVR
jgi:hypothetical protein